MNAPTAAPPRRTAFLIDGFNMFHSVKRAESDLGGIKLKWLDLPAIIRAKLYLFGPNAVIHSIHYFSAYATHLERESPRKVARHRAFVRALTASGVKEHIHRFQRKDCFCPECEDSIVRHEEKMTDVAIAVMMLKLAARDEVDSVVLMSGDTDVVPAMETFKELFPLKRLYCLFPFARENGELRRLSNGAFTLSKEEYRSHQFPVEVRLPSNKHVRMPPEWLTATPSP